MNKYRIIKIMDYEDYEQPCSSFCFRSKNCACVNEFDKPNLKKHVLGDCRLLSTSRYIFVFLAF